MDRYGRLDGVLHAAGLPGMGLMDLKDPVETREVLAPKVAGTQALLTALQGPAIDVPVDLVVLFSSVAALTGGGPGQVDYCAANAFLDARAQAAAQETGGPRLLSVGWGEWQWNSWDLALAGFGSAATRFLRENRERIGITVEAGWDLLLRALAQPEPHVVVSPQDLGDLVAVSADLTVDRIASLGTVGGTQGHRHPRPPLRTPYEPAPDGLPALVADLWGQALGLAEVGMLDNFFELGGNSLLAVDLVARIRRALGGAAVPPHVLYEAPTIRGLLRYLETSGSSSADDTAHLRRARGAWRRDTVSDLTRVRGA